MAYADSDDYIAWTGEAEAPTDIDARLAQASLEVEMAILVEFDEADEDTALALQRATVIHASREKDPTSETSEYEELTLGPLRLKKGGNPGPQRTAAARLVPLARDVLIQAGLLYRGATSYGSAEYGAAVAESLA